MQNTPHKHETDSVFDGIETFRKTDQAQVFAEQWIQEARNGNIGPRHMDLVAWQKCYPPQALGIILILLEKMQHSKVGGDEDVFEKIAGMCVQEIVEWPDDSFIPVLVEAIRKCPVFELCTRGNRREPESQRWRQMASLVPVTRC